jgi:hypothetical protein
MARTAFTVTDTGGPSGAVLPAMGAVDAVNGNSIANTGRESIEITNGSGGTLTVTFQTVATYQGYAIADDVQTIAAGASKVFGPFDTTLFSSTIAVDWSSATSITARVQKLSSTMF